MTFSWNNFLPDLLNGLAQNSLSVVLFQSANDRPSTSERLDILVGVGGTALAGPNSLLLNNKQWEAANGSSYSSVSRLVAEFPAALIGDWALWARRPLVPDKALPLIRLVVEDASADSVLGVLYLLARLAGAESSDLPSPWTRAADQWEEEGEALDPYQSWAPLCSSLAHSHYGEHAPSPKSGGLSDEQQHLGRAQAEIRSAWAACLQFMGEAIATGQAPDKLSTEGIRFYSRAHAAVAVEEQEYRAQLSHAHKIQLYLPKNGSTRRRILVDGLLFVEDNPGGVRKLFIRRDRENSSLKSGFAFMAVYRAAPDLQGGGNDIVISLDASRGLSLSDLWWELERRENEAWATNAGTSRPDDNPRKLENPDTSDAKRVNEPWYIAKDGTLLASPRAVRINGKSVLGRQIEWDNVRQAIWSQYNPAKFIHILDGAQNSQPQPLMNCRSVELEYATCKHLLLASYIDPSVHDGGRDGLEPPSLILSQVVRQILAAMIKRGKGTGEIGIDNLLPWDASDVVELPGGHAIITQDGCFLFQDWRGRKLDDKSYCGQFRHASELIQGLEAVRSRLEALAARAKIFVENVGGHRAEKLLSEVSQVRIDLASYRIKLATPPTDYDLRRFRAKLDQRWGIEQLINELQAQAKDVEDAIRSLDTARNQRYLGLFAKWGTPIFLGASLADPVYKGLHNLIEKRAGLAVPASALSWWANLLPLVSWISMAALAVITINVYIYLRTLEDKKK